LTWRLDTGPEPLHGLGHPVGLRCVALGFGHPAGMLSSTVVKRRPVMRPVCRMARDQAVNDDVV
jgi:hypothetical protein